VNNLFLKFFIKCFSIKTNNINQIQLRYFRQKSDNKLNGISQNAFDKNRNFKTAAAKRLGIKEKQ